jgi:CelD/BcsL family acetyltransferase involved in cellulose biosynthesis/SAM-dependent methyltransferase
MSLTANHVPEAAAAPAFAVDIVRSAAGLEALRPEWERLAGTAAEPMQTFAWTSAAARTLHAGVGLHVVAVRRGAALAGVAPLVEVARDGRRSVEFAGSFHLYEPVRLLADSDEARELLCRAIAALHLPMLLQRLDPGPWTKSLRAAASGRAAVLEVPSKPCLRVALGADLAFEAAKLSPARAALLRRKRRQLEKLGAVTLESIEPAPADVERVLRAAFEVEARSWKGAAGSAVLKQPAMFEFFCELGRHYAATGALLVRRLRVGAEIAAVHVAVIQNQSCFELKIGFDEQFARQSPGVLLTLDCLRDDARRGLRSHEFLGSAAEWQQPFATAERPLRNLALYPYNVAGLAALARDGARLAARRGLRVARAAGTSAAQLPRELARTLEQRLAGWRGRWFDWRNRLDTVERIAVADLPDIDARLARHAVHYEATSIPKFERAMRIVGGRARGFTFVDLGSGKGRVLLLAARLPFRRVIGVEISPRLHAAAGANAGAFQARHSDLAPIECVCADASAYDLPDGDLLVFLYNPFDAALLARARDRMLAACARAARRLCVVYINPLHHAIFDSDEFTCDHHDASLAVYWHRAPDGAT